MADPIKPVFEAIRRDKVYEAVARQLETLILEKLKPGDKLPPERELAEMFAVSRSSIRDAIRSLELSGLVEPRQGVGTVVCEVTADSLLNPLVNALKRRQELVSELLEVRKMIEPPLAARAATHASEDEIKEMEDILRRQAEKIARDEMTIEQGTPAFPQTLLSSQSAYALLVDPLLNQLPK